MARSTEVESLIAAGDYRAAAALLEREGDLAGAQKLHERVWDFPAAARLARQRGEPVDELRLLLEARDLSSVASVARVVDALVEGGDPAQKRAAAELCECRTLWQKAALLRRALGELDAARALLERAGLLLEAAELCEQQGRRREAGVLYERLLAAAPSPSETRRAERNLGRVLAALGRHEEAARHLQRALRGGDPDDAGLDEPRLDLAIALAEIGLLDGARGIVDPLRARRPELPPLEALVATRRRSPSREPAIAAPPVATVALAGAAAERPATGEDAPGSAAERDSDEGPRFLGGRYEVLRLLGSGGMGRVYLARDRVTTDEVAVKVLATSDGARSREGYLRFLREARLVASLRHPHLVAIREVQEAHGLLVMEHMTGGTLEDRLHAPLSLARARALLLQLVDGLGSAHACGVIHRDIKPANIFLGATVEAKLGDFGVAHLQDLGATQTAGFIGTLAYMSPEQITGAPLTFACDLYALGVTAFQMLTARLPFCGPDFVGEHLGAAPPPPSSLRPSLPPAFDRLVLRLLEKDPAARHPSLHALERELRALPVDEEVSAPGAEPPPGVTPRDPRARAAAKRSRARGASEDRRYRIEAVIARTASSTVHRAVDERLGRPVIVERFAAGALDGAAGERLLGWLRAMARHGGPHLQRVLRIDRAASEVVYEALLGQRLDPVAPQIVVADVAVAVPAVVDDAAASASVAVAGAALREIGLGALRALLGPHAEGVAHGSLGAALIREAGGATLTVAGFSPVLASSAQAAPSSPTSIDPSADLDALRALLVARGAVDLPARSPSATDDAAALLSWARSAPP